MSGEKFLTPGTSQNLESGNKLGDYFSFYGVSVYERFSRNGLSS